MTKKVITRFAPSPTGKLHVGNTRTALINFLYAKKHDGEFILRIDDTDLARSTDEYKEAIINDLNWLGLNWDITFKQSSRIDYYNEAKMKLIKMGRLYPCYESQEELEIKRKLQLSSGKPPLYDRAALSLTDSQKSEYEASGRSPHYRFLMQHNPIEWEDMVKGNVHYKGEHISDPIVIREDGTMTYMLCSTVDDIDYNISHIIRGEDHVSNTAIQKQMFEAFGADIPIFGHLSLVKSTDDKISKRTGGFDIESMREIDGLEAMAINSFFSTIGTSKPVTPYSKIDDLVANFDISTFSKSPTTYIPEDLMRINHKIVSNLEYEDIDSSLKDILTKDFWNSVRANLITAKDALEWWNICHESPKIDQKLDVKLLEAAAILLPEGDITDSTWSFWTKSISEKTGAKGRDLFMPIRIALTGMEHGPELQKMLPLIGRQSVINRLTSAALYSK